MNIPTNSDNENSDGFALFNLSFRVFFLSGAIFSIISICLWAAVFLFQFSLPIKGMSSIQWHAHEMIYGYAMAVIAGFLLTAAKNWTGVQTVHGKPLVLMFVFWALARILFLFGAPYLALAGLFDIAFTVMFIVALTYPIVKVKQWKQLAIVFKILFLLAFNILFYLGAMGLLSLGVHWGIYGGLYLVISLVLTLGRRVLPFFIEKGVDQPVQLRNSRFLDLSSLVLFLLFTLVEVFFNQPALAAYLSLGLFAINARRLIGWHTPGLWKKSLLWSLYLGFWFICIGFLLFALAYFLGINKFLAIHAFAFGGVGLMTLGMMSRVALGHSGRGVRNPPTFITWAFVILISGSFIRVFLPIFDAQHYLLWIGLSQLMWIIAFSIFTFIYLPMLVRPRIDGRPG